jgi:hypothetical protein
LANLGSYAAAFCSRAFPGPGQELVDPPGGMIRQTRQDVGEQDRLGDPQILPK